ncbi:probable sugar phosphate/phosphate translocator [Tanacetum coccineum]
MFDSQSYTTRRSSNPKLPDSTTITIPTTPTGENRHTTGKSFFTLSPSILTAAIIGACLVTILVCGNTSLRYLPVSFNQAIGATTPFFTAVFAYIITCKKETVHVYLALVPVVCGIVIASNSEPLFHLFGFLMCVGSTSGRGLKSVVQGVLLSSDNEKLNSMNLLLYMAPMASLILLPVSLCIEGNVFGITVEKARTDWFIVFLLFGNGSVAYLVNLTNFLVTKHTSALTLQVLGNAKAAVAAVVSVLIFKNPVNVMGVSGFGVTIFGVVLYSEAKKRYSCDSVIVSVDMDL